MGAAPARRARAGQERRTAGVGLEVDPADSQQTASGGARRRGAGFDELSPRGDVADRQVLDQVRPGPGPGQGGKGEVRQRAVWGDQGGVDAIDVGTERVPSEPANLGRGSPRCLHVVSDEGPMPSTDRLIHRPDRPERRQNHGPARSDDERQQAPLAGEWAFAAIGMDCMKIAEDVDQGSVAGKAAATWSGPGAQCLSRAERGAASGEVGF